MTETVVSLSRSHDAPRHARRLVRDLVAPERADDATLLVSELVTTAVKYGPEGGEISLIVSRDRNRTRFTVHDPGLGPLPAMRAEDDPGPGGHGLRLVDALSNRWGVERGSTRVWFELDG
jgi:anti-sigma regulatory factor (Ser/Thr protein kinase)